MKKLLLVLVMLTFSAAFGQLSVTAKYLKNTQDPIYLRIKAAAVEKWEENANAVVDEINSQVIAYSEILALANRADYDEALFGKALVTCYRQVGEFNTINYVKAVREYKLRLAQKDY